MTGAVAAGHSETASTAIEILQEGGNAFDAVVAAHLTACVAEPVLSSLGGGGFLLAKPAGQKNVLYDFFTQTPFQKKESSEITFYPISADFGVVEQEFQIGPGSMAAPGTVKGLFAIHKDLCTMPFSRLAEPAIKLARAGVQMNAFQAIVLDIVKPIYQSNKEVKNIYESNRSDGDLIGEGENFKLPVFADFMESLVNEGESFFYEGEIAKSIALYSKEFGGHLTLKDFPNYRVLKRDPLKINFKNSSIMINPPPASGGILIAFALKLCESLGLEKYKPGTADYLKRLAEVQEIVNKARIDHIMENPDSPDYNNLLDESLLENYRNLVYRKFSSERGTTHISVADKSGNIASLTTSNGEGSGVLIPGTSVMMNNMLGEEDLYPGGLGSWKPNERITSMMAPGILELPGGKVIAFGSGGSNRIRTAILQVLLNLTVFGEDVQSAVHHSRIHAENRKLNIEYGFENPVIDELIKAFPDAKIWDDKSLFFGGVHVVSSSPGGDFSGCGDPRRGGVFMIAK